MIFKVEYYNFMGFNNLNVCINYNINMFLCFLVIGLIFESVICGNLIINNYSLFKNLYVFEKYYNCFYEMEFYNLMFDKNYI